MQTWVQQPHGNTSTKDITLDTRAQGKSRSLQSFNDYCSCRRLKLHLPHVVHLQHPLVHLHLPGGHVHDAPSQPLQTQGQHPPWQLSPHWHDAPHPQSAIGGESRWQTKTFTITNQYPCKMPAYRSCKVLYRPFSSIVASKFSLDRTCVRVLKYNNSRRNRTFYTAWAFECKPISCAHNFI